MSRDEEPAAGKALRDGLWVNLQEELDAVEFNGRATRHLPHSLNIATPGIETRSQLMQLKHDVALSTGSGCTAAKVEPCNSSFGIW